jgi:hypothetical protein
MEQLVHYVSSLLLHCSLALISMGTTPAQPISIHPQHSSSASPVPLLPSELQ